MNPCRPKLNDLLLVEWVDSSTPHSGWENIDKQCIDFPYACKSVGWVKKINDHSIMLVPHVAGNLDDGLGILVIPRVAIVKTRKLQ